jgi:molecular chaperone DnaJ
MTSTDPFHILGLQPGAPRDEVRRAYRKLAMRWHPDRNQHSKASEERFKHIKSAYEIAVDAAAYRAWLGSRAAAPAAGARGPTAAHAASPAEPPLEQTLELSLEEAARGGRRTIRVARQVACAPCGGRGRVEHAHSIACPQCHGIGRRRGAKLFSSETCPACSGRGYARHVNCEACSGHGSTVTESVFDVLVPVGLRHGETLRLARSGGSVLLQITHLPHPLLTLQGDDLHCEVPVDVLTFLAGGEIEVPTLDRSIRIQLPAPSPAAEVRVVGKGFPRRHGKRAGDLVLHLQAVYPKDLAPVEIAQLRQLAAGLASRTPALHDWKKLMAQRQGQ